MCFLITSSSWIRSLPLLPLRILAGESFALAYQIATGVPKIAESKTDSHLIEKIKFIRIGRIFHRTHNGRRPPLRRVVFLGACTFYRVEVAMWIIYRPIRQLTGSAH